METGEAQWVKGMDKAIGLKEGETMDDDTRYKDLKDFITQTIESLGRELAEKQKMITCDNCNEQAINGDITKAVSMEDIYSIFKDRYGVDIGGKGK